MNDDKQHPVDLQPHPLDQYDAEEIINYLKDNCFEAFVCAGIVKSNSRTKPKIPCALKGHPSDVSLLSAVIDRKFIQGVMR